MQKHEMERRIAKMREDLAQGKDQWNGNGWIDDKKGQVPDWAWCITWGVMLLAVVLNLIALLMK